MRKAYPSDLTDQQWAIIEPLIPVHAVGRPRINDMREVLNAIFYLSRSGCQWDMLPHDLPAKSTVSDYFAQWRDDDTWQRILDALRREVRQAAGRDPEPRTAGNPSPNCRTTCICDVFSGCATSDSVSSTTRFTSISTACAAPVREKFSKLLTISLARKVCFTIFSINTCFGSLSGSCLASIWM